MRRVLCMTSSRYSHRGIAVQWVLRKCTTVAARYRYYISGLVSEKSFCVSCLIALGRRWRYFSRRALFVWRQLAMKSAVLHGISWARMWRHNESRYPCRQMAAAARIESEAENSGMKKPSSSCITAMFMSFSSPCYYSCFMPWPWPAWAAWRNR